jgi:hypothetical protein
MGGNGKNRSTVERAIGSALLIAIGLAVVYRETLIPHLNVVLSVLVAVAVLAIILVLSWRNRQYRMAQKAARDSYRAAEPGTQEPERDP